jgi:hypothetical protein
MVRVAELVPRVRPPVGVVRLRLTVSSFSSSVSPRMVTSKLFVPASVGLQLRVPLVAV